jgi:ribosomal protein S18 acetylase RimI-like enzyme
VTVELPDGAEIVADLHGFGDAVLSLEAPASAPYHRFVFDSEPAADAFRRLLFGLGVAEYSPPAARLLLVRGEPVALLATLPPTLLRRRRLAAAAAVARSGRYPAGSPELRRMQLASSTLGPVDDRTLYLARLSVADAVAGRGVGRLLVDRALDEARRLGLARCALDVAVDNERAIGLYRRCGFGEVGCAVVEDPETGRTLGHRHLVAHV